jgi:hypothetical protein
MQESEPIRSNRLEDLGRIREILSSILERENIFDECNSKHTITRFL